MYQRPRCGKTLAMGQLLVLRLRGQREHAARRPGRRLAAPDRADDVGVEPDRIADPDARKPARQVLAADPADALPQVSGDVLNRPAWLVDPGRGGRAHAALTAKSIQTPSMPGPSITIEAISTGSPGSRSWIVKATSSRRTSAVA